MKSNVYNIADFFHAHRLMEGKTGKRTTAKIKWDRSQNFSKNFLKVFSNSSIFGKGVIPHVQMIRADQRVELGRVHSTGRQRSCPARLPDEGRGAGRCGGRLRAQVPRCTCCIPPARLIVFDQSPDCSSEVFQGSGDAIRQF